MRYTLPIIMIVSSWGCGSGSSEGTTDTGVATETTASTETSVASETSVTETTPDDTSVVDTQIVDTQVDDTSAPDDTQVADSSAPDDTNVAETVDDADTTTADTTVAASCEDRDDCTVCAFGSAPATVEDCYCVICPDTVMSKTQCDANAAAWDATCSGDKWASTANCPVPRCLPPVAPECEDKQCVAGAEPMCRDDEECQRCPYARPVTSAEDCYCTLCGTTLDKETCAANQATYEEFCVPWPKPEPCPQALCLFPGPPVCNEGVCGDHPDGCNFAEDCGMCSFAQVPKSAEDCACPMCPQPHSTRFCEEVQEANDTVCADFPFDECLPPPCPFPGEATCGEDKRCTAGEILEPR